MFVFFQAFGLSGIASQPLLVKAHILPQARIQYGNGKIIDPQLSGGWNLASNPHFVCPPPYINGKFIASFLVATFSHCILYSGPVLFEVIYAYSQARHGWNNPVYQFVKQLEDLSNRCGVPFRMLSSQAKFAGALRDLDQEIESISRRREANFILVILGDDTWYSKVKLAADKRSIITQCVRLQKIEKLPGIPTCMLMLMLLYYSYVQSNLSL